MPAPVSPPPLPPRLTHVRTVAAIGSTLCLLGAAGLLVAALLGLRPLDIWFTTCLAGAAIGALGYGINRWQRAAAQRGSRTAQPGADGA